jgi:UTP--glucose-1-phosphate uridylyltransferase
VALIDSRGGVPPVIELDARFYKLLADFDRRFPAALSLAECERLTVQGDVTFGEGVVVKGIAEVSESQCGGTVAAGSRLGA